MTMHIQRHRKGASKNFGEPLKFLDMLLKLETWLDIVMHKHWNRNHFHLLCQVASFLQSSDVHNVIKSFMSSAEVNCLATVYKLNMLLT